MERASSLERCAGIGLQPWHELGGASRCSTVRVFGGKAALEEALDVSAWRVRGPGAAGGSGMLGMHGGAAGAASLIPGMLLEQEVWGWAWHGPCRSSPTSSHPAESSRRIWAVSGLSLVLLSPGIALALPSAASLGLDGAATQNQG